jgi:hypothetical protein
MTAPQGALASVVQPVAPSAVQGALAPPASPVAPAVPQPVDLVPDAMRAPEPLPMERLARADPEMFMKVREMDTKQRTAAAEALGKQLDIGGRVMMAVLKAPPEQQADLYRNLRLDLESAGVIDLPDEWDPATAQARMRAGMDVRSALIADDRERRTDWAIEDDLLDNTRADRNTESMVEHRDDQEAIARRGQDLTDRRGRYGIGVSSADRRRGQDLIDTRTRRGQDITDERGRRGQDLTDKRARDGVGGGRRRGGAAGANGGTYSRIAVNAKGEKVGWNGKEWVPVGGAPQAGARPFR